MVRLSVAQMNLKLVELNSFFTEKTQQFTHQISLHEGKFTQKDFIDFNDLVSQIKEQSMQKIRNFMNQRFNDRCQTYETQISSYTETHDQVEGNLRQFSKYLQESTLELKQEQNRKQKLLQHFSQKFSQNVLMKKAWKGFNDYRLFKKQQALTNQKMSNIYKKNLKKKVFFPWRTLTYKQGYQNTVRNQTQDDIKNIHDQYKGIIDILKTKINETDNLIKVKKAAKGEFTYALSKNLLKTISNLSLEVMSLNQISLRDQEFDNQETGKFIGEVEQVIKQKLEKVRQYKRQISGQNHQVQGQRRKKITFL